MYIYPDLMALVTTPFEPEEDAYKLKSIMKGRYENLIIFYLSTIPNDWRQEVADVFFHEFGRNLTKDLQSLLSKEVHDLISVIMTPPAIYQCTMLNYYLKGPGNDKRLLLEILCTVSKPEVAEIVETYEMLYDQPLAQHMSSEPSDDLRRLLTHIINGARYEDSTLDYDRAWEAVLQLDHEGPAAWGMDQGTLVQILANESFTMMRLIFKMYKIIDGRSIEEVIRTEIYGELKNAMSAIVSCVLDPAGWLAARLRGVMSGSDPDGAALARIVVTRAETDLAAISRAYHRLYDTTLPRAILDFSEWRDTCRCLGNSTFRRLFSSFYKPRNVATRNIAKKILHFTMILDDGY